MEITPLCICTFLLSFNLIFKYWVVRPILIEEKLLSTLIRYRPFTHYFMDTNMSGKITLPHKCPKCGVTARTAAELETIFGYRNLKGGATNQSQCKKCR